MSIENSDPVNAAKYISTVLIVQVWNTVKISEPPIVVLVPIEVLKGPTAGYTWSPVSGFATVKLLQPPAVQISGLEGVTTGNAGCSLTKRSTDEIAPQAAF